MDDYPKTRDYVAAASPRPVRGPESRREREERRARRAALRGRVSDFGDARPRWCPFHRADWSAVSETTPASETEIIPSSQETAGSICAWESYDSHNRKFHAPGGSPEGPISARPSTNMRSSYLRGSHGIPPRPRVEATRHESFVAGSQRRRGYDVDIPRRRVFQGGRLRRGRAY